MNITFPAYRLYLQDEFLHHPISVSSRDQLTLVLSLQRSMTACNPLLPNHFDSLWTGALGQTNGCTSMCMSNLWRDAHNWSILAARPYSGLFFAYNHNERFFP